MNKIVFTQNEEETQKLGENLAKEIKAGTVLLLYGDLGSGKTTFLQGFAKGLSIKKHISSPTFLIVRRYNISRKDKKRNLKYFYHADLYRINSLKEVEDVGLLEMIGEGDSVVAIEWAEKLDKLTLPNAISIFFEYIDENKRKITIQYGKTS